MLIFLLDDASSSPQYSRINAARTQSTGLKKNPMEGDKLTTRIIMEEYGNALLKFLTKMNFP
jgi:hypothetical protein